MRGLARRHWLAGAALALAALGAHAVVCNPLSPENKGPVAGTATHAETRTDWKFAAWWTVASHGDYGLCSLVARADYVILHPILPATASIPERVAAYYAANVKGSCADAEPDKALLYACDVAWLTAGSTRPAPPYAVRSNGTSKTRPTYPVVNGVRGTFSNGSVPIKDDSGRATACDQSERVGNYMRVKRVPGTVALCAATLSSAAP